MLRNELQPLYVAKLKNLAHNIEADQYQEDWLGYCMLPWPWHIFPFLDGTKVWWSAVKFERRPQTYFHGSYFFRWNDREFFLVRSDEQKRLYVAAPMS